MVWSMVQYGTVWYSMVQHQSDSYGLDAPLKFAYDAE